VDPAWIGVIGALGGVLVTGLIGLVTAVLNHQWQRESRNEERRDNVNDARAALRREAYTRFLVSTDVMTDFLLTQPARSEQASTSDITERLRAIRLNGKKEFDEFDSSYIQVKLLCGKGVEEALIPFHDWFVDQFGAAVRQSNVLRSTAFDGMETEREPLIEAMKVEQEADLEGSTGRGSRISA
jgi:hypothetical protein